MKKKLLLLIPLITLIAVPGCKSDKNRNKKGDVVSAAVLKANTKAVIKNIFGDFDLSNKELSYDNIDAFNYENGFLVIQTHDGNTHLYSVLKDKEILAIPSSTPFVTYESNVAGGYVSYVDSEGVSIYDSLGNELVKDSKRIYNSLTITSGLNSNSVFYCDIKFDDISLYYLYNDEGVATVHSTEIGDDYGSGTTVKGLEYVLLDDFGHPGYQRIKNSSRYIIFDKKGNEISSFTDPDADAEFFVGDYLIYQNSVKLDNNNNNYDFISANGERYSLETYRINYLTAKKEAIKVSYLLSTGENDIHSFRNAKGIYTYSYANLKTISDKKILSNTLETYIIDSAGALHDNVTGINLGAFERLGDNYYNTDSKTIYDGNLNELSILTHMNPRKVDNADMIICSLEGKCGAVNQKGKVVLPFEYDLIYADYISNNKALVVDDGVLKVVSFDSNKMTHEDVRTIDNGTVSYFSSGIYKVGDNYIKLFDGEGIELDDSLTSINCAISYATSVSKLAVIEGTNYRTAEIKINH